MNKIKLSIVISLFLYNCSLNPNSKFWTEEQDLSKDNKNYKIIKVFKEDENKKDEFNKNIEIKLVSKFKNKKFYKNLDNNFGFQNFEGELNKISKYNFSKIKDFNIYKPDPIFHDKGIIFFDPIFVYAKIDKPFLIFNSLANGKIQFRKNSIKYW